MTPEIEKLIEQEAEGYSEQAGRWPVMVTDKWIINQRYAAFVAGAKFYEETILPGILKEKDDEIEILEEKTRRSRKQKP